MKKLDTTPIIAGVGYPPSKKGFDFLYASNKEMFKALAQGMAGQNLTGSETYVLSGCVKTALGGSNFSFSEGYMFNVTLGEIYFSPAVASIAIATEPILNIDISAGIKYSATYNPVLFTDNTNKNVHANEQMVISDGALGSGLINYADLIFLHGDWIANDAYTSYRRTGGCVYLNGLAGAVGTTMGSASTSLTLPVGFRPSAVVTLQTVPFYDTVGSTFPINGSGTLTIATDGKVTHSGLTGVGARFISLQGISFKI